MEESLRAGARLDREVRASRVADEERVAREDEPRLVAPVAVADGEGAVLRPVAGRVDRPHRDRADLDDGAVGERLVRVLGRRGAVDVDAAAVVEREAAVTGEMIRVRVRLEDARESNFLVRRLLQVLLD